MVEFTLDPQAARSLNSNSDKIYHILNAFKEATTQIQFLYVFNNLSLPYCLASPQAQSINVSREEDMPRENQANEADWQVNVDWLHYSKNVVPSACSLIEHYFVEYFLRQWTMEGIFGSAERFKSVRSLKILALKGLSNAIKTYKDDVEAGQSSHSTHILDPTVDIYQKFRPYGQLIRPEPTEPEDEPPSPAGSSSSHVSFYSQSSEMMFPMEKYKDPKITESAH